MAGEKNKLFYFRYLASLVIIAAVYYTAARLGLMLALEHTNASPVWPPSGIAFALVLILGYRIWPGIALGAFLANVVTFLAHAVAGPISVIAVSLLIAAGNTLEALLGAFLLQLLIRARNPFTRSRNVFKFVFIALFACIVASTVGATALFSFGIISRAFYGAVWLTWWLGDVMGILVLTPLFMVWQERRPFVWWGPLRFLELILFTVLFSSVIQIIFTGRPLFGIESSPLTFIIFPFVIWAAFRFGQIGVSFAVFGLSAVTIWLTIGGLGPFAKTTQNESLVLLQTFIATVSLKGLFLATVLTERRRVEQTLRESREKTHLILETASDAFIGMDEAGFIVDWNRQAEKIFGWLRKEAIGRSLAETIIPPSLREQHRIGLKRFLATREGPVLNKTIEINALHRNGHEFLVELTIWPVRFGGTYHFNAVLRDITERKRAEERLKQVVESTPNAMVMVDGTGKIVLVNKTTEKVFGYPREELIGQSIEILVPRRFHATHEGYRTDFFKEPESRPMGAGRDLHGLRKDGTEVPVEIGLNPIQTSEGVFVLAAIVDITERKQAETRQTEFLEKIKRANQELTDFAHVVSHDLKAPLRGIAAVVEWLEKDYWNKLDEKGREWLRLLSDRVNLAHALIDGILEYSSVDRLEGRVREVDLNELVKEVIVIIEPPQNVAFEILDKLPVIRCDQIRIRQVFQNLIGNAVEYTDKPNGQVKIGCVSDGGYWKFSVSDNGPGIEEKYFGKIFQMFQTLQPKGKSKSTGIGLALAKKIVERYGGKIWVESKIGEGSVFFFTFPKNKGD